MMFDIEESRELLKRAGVFYDCDDGYDSAEAQTLNQNDTWGWASAFGQFVPDVDLPVVAELFFSYGYCGILYWVSRKNDDMKSEFADVNRQIEFVRREEEIRAAHPDSSKRAYEHISYTIGEQW